MMSALIINRAWAMPNKWTFSIQSIRDLLNRYVGSGKGWVDPFAGKCSPAEITNDLNPEMPTMYHLRANDFLKELKDNKFDGILFDPPYNLSQLKECYQSIGIKLMKEDINYTYSLPKDIAAKKVVMQGYAISCGWNSIGFGKNRGFKIIEILLVCHGGHHNDTIVTVEQKIWSQEVLSF